MSKPSPCSVTEEACRCGMLANYASGYLDAVYSRSDQPARSPAQRPVHFDAATNEYSITTTSGTFRLYHCFFCGGAAPASLPRSEFAIITFEEEARIASLMRELKTLADIEAKFGKPDIETEDVRMFQEEDGQQRCERLRQIVYSSLTQLAEVWVTEELNGTVRYYLRSKRLNDSEVFDWSTVPRHLRPGYLPAWKRCVLWLIGVKQVESVM